MIAQFETCKFAWTALDLHVSDFSLSDWEGSLPSPV